MRQFGSYFMVFLSTYSVIDCLHRNRNLENKVEFNTTPRCICPLRWLTEYCRIEESANIKPMIFTDPSWDDYSPTSSFKTMENQICEEMGNIFGARRVWCRLIYLRKGSKIHPTSDGFNEGNQQDEPLDNGDIEPYDTPCSDHSCSIYERCTYTGMGYRCKCKLFYFGEPCNKTKGCDNNSCKTNQSCPSLDDCYKCDCNLFKLEQICEHAIFDLLLSGIVTLFTIAIILFIFVGRRRGRRPSLVPLSTDQ